MTQKVCIVSLDILGPVRDGGAGTAMVSLAELLAENGHEVTLLYPPAHTDTAPLTAWALEYEKKRIRFVSLFLDLPEAQLSYAAYQWLKKRDFDVIHFHETRGVGYWSCKAKRLGLAFKDAVLVCHIHGQTLWLLENSGVFLSDIDQLRVDYLERCSIEQADVIFSPSRYMIDCMTGKNLAVPAARVVRPNLLPSGYAVRPASNAAQRRAVRELVFFGRLETGKGIELFCEALNRLAAAGTKPPLITFLGKEGMAGSEPALATIARASADWEFPFQFLTDFDMQQARNYLSSEGRLAIIASAIENSPYAVLECLAQGVPFLASDAGGTAELIQVEDRAEILFRPEPSNLAAALERTLSIGAIVARPSVEFAPNRADWLAWHESLQPARPAIVGRQPRVSVCMSHFNRPKLLEQAIRSIEVQTYADIELILVDDASPDAEARAYLDALEPRFATRGWQLIRNPTEMWTGAARNQAAARASGEFILMMDDDNIARPEEVETFVTAALHSGADVLTCQQQTFASNDGLPPPLVADLPVGWMPIGANLAEALYENCIGDLNMFVRRTVWNAIGGFSEERYGCEDYEFLLKAILAGYIVECVPEILFHYRKSDRQLAGRYDDMNLYRSFNRPLRAFAGHVPEALRPALALASNRSYHEMRDQRLGYWERKEADFQLLPIIRAPLGSAEALRAFARLALSRGQSETARRITNVVDGAAPLPKGQTNVPG